MLKTLPFAWTPRDIYGARLTFFPGYADMLRQEQFGYSSTNPVITRVTADGQPVGTVILPIDGHTMTCYPGYADATRPDLHSDSSGGRNSFLRFGASSQQSVLQVVNSTAAFRSIQTTQQFTIALFIRFQTGGSIGGDGTNQSILDNSAQTDDVGFSLYKYSDNKIYFDTGNGSGYPVNINSGSTTLTADGNWHKIVIQCAGPGTGTVSMTIDGGTPVVGNVAAGLALGTSAAFSLLVGMANTGSHYYGQFDLDNLLIADRVISAADLAKWAAFNPPRNYAVNSLLRENDPRATECDLSALSHSFQWCRGSVARDPISQAPLVFTSTTPSTSSEVTADGNAVAYLQNMLGPHLLRDCTQSNSSYQPLWKVGAKNGRPTIRFAGTTTGSGTSSMTDPDYLMFGQQWYPGDKTWYWVGVNNSVGSNTSINTQSGSHLLGYSAASGNGYWVATGTGYDTSLPDNNKLIIHPTGDTAGLGPSIGTASSNGNGGTGYNIYHGRQLNGTFQMGVNGNWSAYTASGGCFVPDSIGLNYHQCPVSGWGTSQPQTGGADTTGNWELNGDCAEWGVVNAALPDHVFYKLLRRLASEYAISNMNTSG